MLPIRQSEELNPLQVLLMVFVKFGLSTPYDLITQVGLSVGLTSPALKRMEEAGLLASTPGGRKSMRFALTDKGEEELGRSLKSSKPSHWRLGRFDTFESAPRAILLAWAAAGLDEAVRCVEQAAEELRFQEQKKAEEAKLLRFSLDRLRPGLFPDDPAADKGTIIATAYRWLKAVSDAELLKLQAEAIMKIAPLLSALPEVPPILHEEGSVG